MPEPAPPPPPAHGPLGEGPAGLSRRELALLGGGLLGLGAVGLHLVDLPAAAPGYHLLSFEEIAVVEAVAAVLFPPGAFVVFGGDGGTAPGVDALIADGLDPAAARPFRYVLRSLELGTLASRGQRFSALGPTEAREVYATWAAADPAPRRLGAESLKAVLGMAFFRRPEVLGQIGWKRGCGA